MEKIERLAQMRMEEVILSHLKRPSCLPGLG